jgi:hypothetical protein
LKRIFLEKTPYIFRQNKKAEVSHEKGDTSFMFFIYLQENPKALQNLPLKDALL